MESVAAASEPTFKRWIPLAQQVVRRSLSLGWKDVFEIYTYIPTIPLAEALALEARRVGSDTHITLMTDDLWFTSMQELPVRWLRLPSPAELAINKAITAMAYLGGPADARRMREIPPEKFDANALGNLRQDAPKRRRRVRHVDLPIGRVCRERAEAYGLDFEAWERSYHAALAVDLREIQAAGRKWARTLGGREQVRLRSDAGTDLTFETKPIPPAVDDGILSPADVRRGLLEASLPAGKVLVSVRPDSAEGEVVFTDPILLMGRAIRGVRMRFHGGVLVDFDAMDHRDLLASAIRAPGGARPRLDWISIGLNPAAEPCMLDNSIVRDDVTLGFGPHSDLEPRAARVDSYFASTIGQVSVEVLPASRP